MLVGARPGGEAPPCRIIDVGHRRDLALAVEVADQELGPIATHELWAEVYDRIAAHARAERTTIVFVNTRRLVERVAHQLEERLGQGRVAAHHGSTARRLRLEAEERLKSGAVPVVVATASLAAGDAGPMRLARQLLRRYGVVTRELTARESRVTSWRALLGALRTLEARGEVRDAACGPAAS